MVMDLDPTDAAILHVLQKDARASLRTIAKNVGVSVPTVSSHLRNLEQLGIVRGYRVLLGPGQLESRSIALVVKAKTPAAEDVARRLAARDWARRVLMGPGGSILVDVDARGDGDAGRILREVSGWPGVTDVQAFDELRTVKDEPLALSHTHVAANIACFECQGPIHGQPVKVRRDGRYHYFCCHTCKRLYLERYDRIQTAARNRT